MSSQPREPTYDVVEKSRFSQIFALHPITTTGSARIARPWLSFGMSSESSDGQMGWTVIGVLQETGRRIRGTKKRTTQEAVDVEALIMRLTYKERPIALRDIKQCSESFFQMAGGSAGICRLLHLAMACPNCDGSHWVRGRRLVHRTTDEHEYSDATQASLGYLRVSVRMFTSPCYSCSATCWARLERILPYCAIGYLAVQWESTYHRRLMLRPSLVVQE